jgi:hypothetical protein
VSEIAGLIERVRKLTGPDRETDAAVADLLYPLPAPRWPFVEGSLTDAATLPVTSSVDAVLGLAERILPVPDTWTKTSPPSSGWKMLLYRGMTPTGAPYGHWTAMIRRHAAPENDQLAATPALAILLALLTALQTGETP